MRIKRITLHSLRLPLPKPYKVAFKTYETFDPIIVEVYDRDGKQGWGESHIPEGYSSYETPKSGWDFCRNLGDEIVGAELTSAKETISANLSKSPMAATAMMSALESLEDNPILILDKDFRIPLLAPLRSKTLDEIPDEVEQLIEAGFKTIKVKVGWDVDEDATRVNKVQLAAANRAIIRLDANRNFGQEDAVRFSQLLISEGIELFEQPCGAEEWAANTYVASVSPVPIMLDESIYTIDDVERAGAIKGVEFCKMKLKRAGSIDHLKAAMDRCRSLGMGAVVGDGVATEIGNYMEACCARLTTKLAGEMNGFLKPDVRLFSDPLLFERGDIQLRKGFKMQVDRMVLEKHTIYSENFVQ